MNLTGPIVDGDAALHAAAVVGLVVVPVLVVDRGAVLPREGGVVRVLECVQQSHFGSRFSFWHFNLQIEMQIEPQMRRTVIHYLKSILNTSKLKIEMQIEMKWCTFLSVQQLWQISTLKHKLR